MNTLLNHGWLIALVAVAAGLMTACLRRYALARSLMDIPNARSSHSVPTPRGGGVAIVLAFLLALPVLHRAELLPTAALWAMLGAGGCVALVGFLDDHGHVAARWRGLVAGEVEAALVRATGGGTHATDARP